MMRRKKFDYASPSVSRRRHFHFEFHLVGVLEDLLEAIDEALAHLRLPLEGVGEGRFVCGDGRQVEIGEETRSQVGFGQIFRRQDSTALLLQLKI